ncbi:MAG: L-threonine 3-dehydrogenase [Candidatus Micrarchaeota archaeon]
MKGTMRAIQKPGPTYGAKLVDAEIPRLGPRDVLVKIRACSICGTDMHIYEWDNWAKARIKTPMIFGHEFCGDIVEVGNLVSKVRVGDFVSGETHLADFNCWQCREANAHICENLKILGVDTQGSYAEYVAIPENNAIVNDKSLPVKWASAQEPLGNAVHTVFAQPVSGKKVSIFGCGPIGLCAIQLCKAAGAVGVYAVDVNEYRLNMAEKMGADVVINAAKEDAAKRILEETGRGADVFLEISGNASALQSGLKSLRPAGEAAILGVFPDEVPINFSTEVVFKQATIRGINGRRLFTTWHQVGELLRAKKVDLGKIVTHEFKLEEYEKAFELMKSGNCSKVVMYP